MQLASDRKITNWRKANIRFSSYLSLNIGDIWVGLRQEPWSFWFLCLYVMLEYTRIHRIYSWLGILPIVQLSLMAVLASTLTGREPKWVKATGLMPLLLFFLQITFSSALAFNQKESFDNFVVIINWMLLYYLIVTICTTKKRLFILFLLLILCCFKLSQHGFITSAQRGFGFAGWGISGPPGWFQNAADLGMQLLLFVAWVAGFFLVIRKHNQRWVSWLFLWMLLTGFVSIVATGNRGSLLGLAPMGLYMLFFFKHRVRNLLILCVLGGAIWYFAPAEFKARFDTAGEDVTSVTRLELWERGIETGKSHDLTGVGYFNWPAYSRYRWGDYNLVIHNSYISVFAELGYPGLLFYLSIVASIMITNFRTRRMGLAMGDDFYAIMPVTLNVGMMGYLGASMFISVQYYPFIYMQLALTAALFASAKKQRSQPLDASEQPAVAPA